MPDVLQVLAEEMAALRRRVEVLEAQEDATTLSRLTLGTGALVLTRTSVTIASGAVAAVGAALLIDTEGAAASDDLDTISGGETGRLLVIQCASNARDVVVKHGTGNIYLSGRVDYTLTGVRDTLLLYYGGSEWRELGQSDNAV